MSNTVRRRRKRPRVDSCAWTTFGWLLRRTAAFATVADMLPPQLTPAWRQYMSEMSSTMVERFVATRLRRWPHRGYVEEFRG
jgi:hypothetical protein